MMRAVCLAIMMLACVCSRADVRVLSIGVGRYPAASGWKALSAANDVRLVKSLFPDARLLEDGAATHAAIVAGMKQLAAEARRGDTVIVHFSGHGQQIVTRMSAEEADGVDEALVPFDAARRRTAAYSGQNHLTDDAFGSAVDAIRRAVGPTGLVVALIDACHSDSMDKAAESSAETYRGTDEIFGAEAMTGDAVARLRDSYHRQDTSSPKKAPGMADVAFVSACRSDQRNYEVKVDGHGYGSLTYYFCKAFREKGLSDLPELLSAIYSGMGSDRTLRFHGQLPAIRSTIGWQPPRTQIAPTLSPLPADDAARGAGGSRLPAWTFVPAIVLFTSIIMLCIRKKRKKKR